MRHLEILSIKRKMLKKQLSIIVIQGQKIHCVCTLKNWIFTIEQATDPDSDKLLNNTETIQI